MFQNDLERRQRAARTECLKHTRMQLAEIPEHVLRADLDGAAASWMKPGRSSRHDLHRLRRRARGRKRGERIGLGIEGIDFFAGDRPVPPGTRWFGEACAYACGSGELIVRLIAAENLSYL